MQLRRPEVIGFSAAICVCLTVAIGCVRTDDISDRLPTELASHIISGGPIVTLNGPEKVEAIAAGDEFTPRAMRLTPLRGFLSSCLGLSRG